MDSVFTISRISIAPVKGTRLIHPDRVHLTEHGVIENRRFVIVGEDGRHLRSVLAAWPILVTSHYDAEREELELMFPDGKRTVGSALPSSETTVTTVEPGARTVKLRIVEGDWNDHLSRLAGAPVRLARPDQPGASLIEPATILSTGSLERLEHEAGHPIDHRRFRMLFQIDGPSAHQEDTWAGNVLRIGDAILRVTEPVDRCVVTTRNAETGERDLDTLRLIKNYRGLREKRIDFGMFATIETPGTVSIGDPVCVL
jgi:uncharacterized protein YcbX